MLEASTKMFSMRPTGCSSSNQEAVISAEMRGSENLTEGKRIERKVEKSLELARVKLRTFKSRANSDNYETLNQLKHYKVAT